MSNDKPRTPTTTAPQRPGSEQGPRPAGDENSKPQQGSGQVGSGQQGSGQQGSGQVSRPSKTPKSKVQTAGAVAQMADEQDAKESSAATESAPTAQQKKPTTTVQKAKPSEDDLRKAQLRMHRVDPWSVMKLAFALSIALAIVTVVAVTIVWAVLGAAGVWDAINSSVATVLSDNANAFDITDYVGFGRIIGLTLIISAVDVVLITALATVGDFLYNLAASLLAGLEITMAEER